MAQETSPGRGVFTFRGHSAAAWQGAAFAACRASAALQVQRELNRLPGLYSQKDSAGDQTDDDAQGTARRLGLIEGYLLPVKLGR